MTTMEALDLSAAYTAPGFKGIALRLLGYATTTPEPQWQLDCDDESCDHEDESCYTVDEPEPEEDRDWVRAVMVGDDEVQIIETTDLQVVPEDGFCPGCGQLGCGHYR